MSQYFFSFIFIALFSLETAVGQTNSKDSIKLEEIVVTGSKIEISRKLVPLSVSQISKQDIESTGQMNILPALNSFVPGVFVTERNILGFGVSNTGAGSITMRGVSSSPNTDVLVLIDGHPQYQGIFGHPLADAYVASDVEKVEIIRGPASILYGSNAMAGVVNIITKQQHENGLKVNLGASYGSYNTQKYFGTIGYKQDKLSLFASYNHDQTDGIRANTDFNINNAYAKLGYEINQQLTLTADFSMAKYIANDNGPMNQPPVPYNINISRGKASMTLENKFENSEGGLNFYHNFGTHNLSGGFHSTDRNDGAMLYQTFKLSSGTNITIGTDFKQYGGTANQGYKHDSLITVNELAAYAYAQQTLCEKLTISAGLRLENNSKFGTEVVPLAGLNYNLTENMTFKGSVSRGFRSPTVMELYLYAPNPALQPERLVNYELSWLQSLLNNRLNLELTAYKVVGSNMIQVVGQGYAAKRENLGSFSTRGVEFSARYTFNRHLSFNANYSYLDLDEAMIAAPRQQMNVRANYRYKIWGLHVSAQYIEQLYTSTQPMVTQNYALLDARLTARPLKYLELFVSVNNLLDQQYQINYGYPMPGINFNAGFNVRF
ncbi:MAG: TonB-dependent receptor [Bacteroidota bacterium]|nr:TonB-dependent receptor [Bacteroidota bacterium]